VLAEQSDEWTGSRRSIGTEILAECRKASGEKETRDTEVKNGAELTVDVIPGKQK
jgi:hypothetical protein